MPAPRKRAQPAGQAIAKRPVGRPTKYDPAFCEVVIDLMASGFSLAACAGEIGVAYDTAREWEKVYPEFSAAVKVGRAQAVLHWEKQLQRVAERGGGPGTATAVIFGLKNRAPEEWRDKQELEHSGPDGGPLQFQRIERVVVDPQN